MRDVTNIYNLSKGTSNIPITSKLECSFASIAKRHLKENGQLATFVDTVETDIICHCLSKENATNMTIEYVTKVAIFH